MMEWQRLLPCILFGLVLYVLRRPSFHDVLYNSYAVTIKKDFIVSWKATFFAGKSFQFRAIEARFIPRGKLLFPVPSVPSTCRTCNITLKCENWRPSSKILLTGGKPAITTRSNKLLLPWLYNGPNNQLYGFRQALYVATRLNRTLVMPIFMKHFTDSKDQEIDPNHRIDVAGIRKLVNVISLDEYKQLCGSRTDVMFLSTSVRKMWGVERLQAAQTTLGLDVIHNVTTNTTSIVTPLDKLLKVPYYPTSNRYRVQSDRKSILAKFNSTLSCAFYALPFREVDFPKLGPKTEAIVRNLNIQQDFRNSTNISDWALNGMIMQLTQPPPYVRELAKLFIEKMFSGGKYISLHWRYDKVDFYQFMCTQKGNPQRGDNPLKPAIQAMCNKVKSINPAKLTKLVYLYMNKNVTTFRDNETMTLYVSAPSSTLPWFMNSLKNDLSIPLQIFNSEHILTFLEEDRVLSRCQSLRGTVADLVALLESEICGMSQVFFRSSYSTYSDNIFTTRRVTGQKYVKYDRRIEQLLDAEGYM